MKNSSPLQKNKKMLSLINEVTEIQKDINQLESVKSLLESFLKIKQK